MSHKSIFMAYKVIELIVPEHDIMEQEHWDNNTHERRLTKKAAMKWFDEQVEAYEIEVPTKYLLRVLTFNGSLYNNRLVSAKDIIRTID